MGEARFFAFYLFATTAAETVVKKSATAVFANTADKK